MTEKQTQAADSEPSPWRLSQRLLGHASVIVFFGALEWGVHRLLQWMGQKDELWAHVVSGFATACFVVSFIVIAGGELIVLCADVAAFVKRRIRG